MIGKTESNPSWSDFLLNGLRLGNVNPFVEEEIREWSEWAETKEAAKLLEYLLSGPHTVH